MVTVLMPVFNGEKYLREAIESVLNQTYNDFEFLIINDGSTDDSLEIINSYKDPRIKLINNENNLKLISTLNLGLDLAKGKYIARMDCDDVCFPERLKEQVDYMEANPEIGILGTWYIRSDNKPTSNPPAHHDEIKVHLLKGSAILHPTAMFRAEFFDKYQLRFRAEFIHAEDYELWVRASELFHLANIPKPLLKYRKHPKQISQSFSREQKETTKKIILYHLKNLGLKPTLKMAKLNLQLFSKVKLKDKQVRELFTYIEVLLSANEKIHYYDHVILKDFLYKNKEQLWDRCRFYSFKTLRMYHQSVKQKRDGFSLKLYIKILKRVLLNTFQFIKRGLSFSM